MNLVVMQQSLQHLKSRGIITGQEKIKDEER